MSKPETTEDKKYTCPSCKSKWDDYTEFSKYGDYLAPADWLEHEVCPDCASECERCGMLRDYQRTFEHCL